MTPRRNTFVVNAVVYPTVHFAGEILGTDALNDLLVAAGLERFVGAEIPDDSNLSIRTAEYAEIIAAIQAHPDGTSILYEIGCRTFRHTIRTHALYYGLSLVGKGLHLLPYNRSSELMVHAVVSVLTTSNPTVVAWSETLRGDNVPNRYIYQETTCAMCFDRRTEEPICVMYAGFIAEAMLWATNKHHSVIETECLGQGDAACKFLIEVVQ